MVRTGSSHNSQAPQGPDNKSPGELAVPVSIHEDARPSDHQNGELLASTTRSMPESDSSPEREAAAALANPVEQKTVISKRQPSAAPSPFPRPVSPIEMGVALRGQRLGHFELGDFVGGGGMGAVFRATDTMLDRTVAVKVLSRDQTDDDILRRFKNEAQSAARLDHPNIARVYYVGEEEGWNFIVFEFIEGQNIRELVVEKGPLPLNEAINYTLQVAEALEHAYRRDVVHRDIKPSNVLVMPNGHVKLVDMGLARLHQVESPANDLTASGVTLGTFDYMSPEQARDPRSADVRSDLYSLGCTLYFMLTGQPPFPEGTVLQKLLSHTSDEPPDPRTLRRDLPEEVTAVVSKMLAKHPTKRYQTPSELIGRLMVLADQLGLEGITRGGTVWVTPADARPSFAERHLPWIVPVLALVLIVFALDRFWPGPDSSPKAFARPQLAPAEPLVEPKAAGETKNQVHPASGGNNANNSSTIAKGPDKPPASTNNGAIPKTPDPAGTRPGVAPVTNPRGVAKTTGGADVPGDFPSASEGVGPPPTSVAAAIGPPAADASGVSPPAGDMTEGMNTQTTTSPAVSPAPKPKVLVLGSADAPRAADELPVESLAEACRLAALHPTVEAIELRFNGDRQETPVEVAVSKLTIRAGSGFSPVLVFRPEDRELADDGRMIRVGGGELHVEGIHLRFELPNEPSEGWALFQLEGVQSLDLRGCTLTIVNAAEDGTLLQNPVSFIEIRTSRMAEMALDPLKKVPAVELPLSISLSRCIARGQATLVRAEKISPFSLQWTQGLFASTERLVETSGAMGKPEWTGLVELDLSQVTIAAARGLCQMKSHEDAPHQLNLDIDCTNCIFLSDPAAPLLEHVGVATIAEAKEKLEFKGKGNFYPSSNLFWRIAPRGTAEATVDVTLDQRDEKWSAEKRAQRAVMWKQYPAANVPVHLHSKADYLLSDNPANPAIRSAEGHGLAGFDSEQLPALAEVKKPAVVVTPATPED